MVVAATQTYAGEVAPAQFDNATEDPYRVSWDKVRDKYGLEIAGRHIVALGFRNAETGSVREPTRPEVVAATERLQLALNPPAPEPVVYTEPAPTTSTSGGYAIPSSIVACESGGDYGAVNPSSGAYGAYQILPSTSASYGCDMSSPAGQDQCAAEIYATEGSSPWVCG